MVVGKDKEKRKEKENVSIRLDYPPSPTEYCSFILILKIYIQVILTSLNKSTFIKKKKKGEKKPKTQNLGLFIFLLSRMKYTEEAGLTDNDLEPCVETGFSHEGKLQDKVNLADGKKFFIQSVWHNCSDTLMNSLYNIAFGIAPLLMYLSSSTIQLQRNCSGQKAEDIWISHEEMQ